MILSCEGFEIWKATVELPLKWRGFDCWLLASSLTCYSILLNAQQQQQLKSAKNKGKKQEVVGVNKSINKRQWGSHGKWNAMKLCECANWV